jgi:hypothetical protein
MFQTKVVAKIKTHILYSITFFKKKVPFMRYGKICYNQTDHRSQYDTACALCMLVY